MATQWTDPSWRSEAETWIREHLTELGFSLVAQIEHSHIRPWATVLRVPTDGGTLWFKANIEPLAFEGSLIALVAARSRRSVARVFANDPVRGWTLMEDAGPLLADLYGEEVPVGAWLDFLRDYAQLQRDAAPVAKELVVAGVPDRTLSNLLDPFERVLESDRLVRPDTDAALTDDELERVRSLMPRLRDAVDALAALGLPDSVQHDDLHPWNVCTQDGRYRFIDWGDACISHPLLSLEIPLQHLAAADTAPARDAYLEPWTELCSYDELVSACRPAALLAQVTGVLKWELISSVLTDEERTGYEEAIPRRLRHLLELACA